MENWQTVYITDKTEKEFFKNICSGSSLNGVLKELNQHLKFIKEKNKFYKNIGIDPDTAKIVKKEE